MVTKSGLFPVPYPYVGLCYPVCAIHVLYTHVKQFIGYLSKLFLITAYNRWSCSNHDVSFLILPSSQASQDQGKEVMPIACHLVPRFVLDASFVTSKRSETDFGMAKSHSSTAHNTNNQTKSTAYFHYYCIKKKTCQ